MDKVREALEKLLERFTGLVNSGDCGFWDVEKEEVVVNARLALSQDNWQPIETAPKDGTEMLVINKHWWTPVNGNNCWIYSKIKQASWNGHQFNNDGLQPTHWQPLPNPPEKK